MTNIMDITIENLANEQFKYLKEYSIEILNKVIEYIQNDNFKSIEEMIVNSPAGDLGEDNYFINFAWNKGDSLDIYGLINELEYLKGVVRK